MVEWWPILLPLAIWRLTYMLVNEEGPLEMFDALRFYLRKIPRTEGLLSCVWCLSVWVSAILLLLAHLPAGKWVVVWLALSALAIAIDVLIARARP